MVAKSSDRFNIHREGQIGKSGMVMVVCIVRPQLLAPFLEAAFEMVEKHIGVVSITDTEVLRAERL